MLTFHLDTCLFTPLQSSAMRPHSMSPLRHALYTGLVSTTIYPYMYCEDTNLQKVNPRSFSAFSAKKSWSLKWNPALSIPLHSWIWLYLHTRLHHTLLADAIFYCLAVMVCLNQYVCIRNDFNQGDLSNICPAVTNPVALIFSEALYGLQQAWKSAHFSYE